MGRVKTFLEEQGLGFYPQYNNFVCFRCVADNTLKKIISKSATTNKCDYCNYSSDKKNIAASLNYLAGAIQNMNGQMQMNYLMNPLKGVGKVTYMIHST